jgi:Patatin-like phospholipase
MVEALSERGSGSRLKTAFVLAGGGSFGAIQVGMLHSLVAHGVTADMVVGSSVGAMNAAYYAGIPTVEGMEQLAKIWRNLRRRDVFPITPLVLLGLVRKRDFLLGSEGLYRLVHTHLPYRNLEDARIPVHIVATDLLSGAARDSRSIERSQTRQIESLPLTASDLQCAQFRSPSPRAISFYVWVTVFRYSAGSPFRGRRHESASKEIERGLVTNAGWSANYTVMLHVR